MEIFNVYGKLLEGAPRPKPVATKSHGLGVIPGPRSNTKSLVLGLVLDFDCKLTAQCVFRSYIYFKFSCTLVILYFPIFCTMI